MRRNPALSNAYRSLPRNGGVLFIDETYNAPGRNTQPPYFYIIGGVLIAAKHLEISRREIRDIVKGDYWHTTEALQQPESRETAKDLLRYCSEVKDTYFVTHQAQLKSSDAAALENVRRECLKTLLTHCHQKYSLKAVVIESRQNHREDDNDRTTARQLKKANQIHQAVPVLVVSPAEEPLLWLPDLVALTYRRAITHTDSTAKFYADYLEASTVILKNNAAEGHILFDHSSHLHNLYDANKGVHHDCGTDQGNHINSSSPEQEL